MISEREIIEFLQDVAQCQDVPRRLRLGAFQIVHSIVSQPNGGDRVVSENESQKEVCSACGGHGDGWDEELGLLPCSCQFKEQTD